MNKSTIYFLFIITGIFATALAYSGTLGGSEAYASGDKKYKDREYYGEKEYRDNDRGYDYKYEGNDYGKQTFVAKMNGDNIRPVPVNTPMTGFGEVIVTTKPNGIYGYYAPSELDYKVSVFDVPKKTDIIAVHLHIMNPGEEVGPHVLTMCGFDNPVDGEGFTTECPEKLKPITAGGAIDENVEQQPQIGIETIDDIVDALNEERGYLQVHTDVNPAGEIRGDLIEKDNYRY